MNPLLEHEDSSNLLYQNDLDNAKRTSMDLKRPPAISFDDTDDGFQFFIVTKDIGNCNYYKQKEGSCIMITDLKNSTNLWAQDQKEMKKQISLHNFILRQGMNKLMCKFGTRNPYDIFKLNEIGDSWEIVISGEKRFVKMYWLAMFILKNYTQKNSNRPKVRIGISSAPEILGITEKNMINLTEINEIIQNKILRSDETKQGYDQYMQARRLEILAGVKDKDDESFSDISSVALSLCFFFGLINDTKEKDQSLTKELNLNEYSQGINDISSETITKLINIANLLLNLTLDSIPDDSVEFTNIYSQYKAMTQGYIIFLKIQREIEDAFIKKLKECGIGEESLPVLLSIEGAGLIYNFYSENIDKIKKLIGCIKPPGLSKSIKMSIIYSNTNNIYPIRDCPSWDFHCYANEDNIYKDCNVPSHIKQEYERQQIFIRYISHTQNIAARLIFAKLAKDSPKWGTEYGRIYSNDQGVINNIKTSNNIIIEYSVHFKGLPNPNGQINVYSTKFYS